MSIYCPRCGQEQVSNETRFCSRCGFLLTGVYDLLVSGGQSALPATRETKGDSPRKRGLKQGLFFSLLTFLIVPIITMLTVWADAEPFAVVISSILFFVGGLLRIAYALLFESNVAPVVAADGPVQLTGQTSSYGALPEQQAIPADNYLPPRAASWRETSDLEPTSVTDSTTKLLSKNQ